MINLTITVSDINTVITYFTHIKLQRANDFDFTSGVSDITNITLVAGQTSYNYNDVSGLSSYWYRSRYINTSTQLESEWSDPIGGEEITYFTGATYPVEESYSTANWVIINKVRLVLGDLKKISREYINDCYENIMGDYYTFDFPERGWPLRVILTTSTGSTEFTSLCNPIIQGYEYLVFSGAQNQIIQNTTLDIWYSSFTYSDKEIKEYYDLVSLPPGISSTAFGADDLLVISTAIDLVEAELQRFVVEASVRVRDGDTEYDPTPGIRARELRLRFLKDKKKDLVDSIIKQAFLSSEGVRIE